MFASWPALLGALLVLGGLSAIVAIITTVIDRDRYDERTRLQILAWARYEVLTDSPGLWTWTRGTAHVRAIVAGTIRECVVRERNGQPWVGLAVSGVEADRRPLT